MKKIHPFNNRNSALSILDNGGRFYNFLTPSGDGKIERSELAKAAGLYTDIQSMSLYFEMITSKLNSYEKHLLTNNLENGLKEKISRNTPEVYSVSDAKVNASIGSTAIIQGKVNHIDSKTQFSGFIMIPMTTNNITTFMMIPIYDQYFVYRIHDIKSDTEFIIAHSRKFNEIPEIEMRFGGIIKELKNSNSGNDKFLEALYYREL